MAYQNGGNKDKNDKCFTRKRPLLIETTKGQKIKMNLKNLGGIEKSEEKNRVMKRCFEVLGYISGDQKASSNVTICSNGFEIFNLKSGKNFFSKIFETNNNRAYLFVIPFGKQHDFLVGVEGTFCP